MTQELTLVAHAASDLPVALVVTLVKGAYHGASIAEHGTPYDDDAHVLLIFLGPAFWQAVTRSGRSPRMPRRRSRAPGASRSSD
jgi:hypothetical protein